MSTKEASTKSNEDKHGHSTLYEKGKHVVEAVTESMFETSSVFGVLTEPHPELTHSNEKKSAKSGKSGKEEDHHHCTMYEKGKQISDAITGSMFESSSVYGVLVEPHPELHEHHETKEIDK